MVEDVLKNELQYLHAALIVNETFVLLLNKIKAHYIKIMSGLAT